MSRRPRPSYLQVVGDPLDEPDDAHGIIAPSPHGSARAVIAVNTAPIIAAGLRIVDVVIFAITDAAFDEVLTDAFSDTASLRAELGEVIGRHLQKWVAKWIVTGSEINDA